MAFTKVVGAGIHTLSNIASHNINSSGIITATKFVGPMENGSGISTFYDLRVTNNLTVEGTTTTLDTKLVEVDKIEVEADSTNVAIAVTQTGTGDLIRLYDGASQVVTVDDEGTVSVLATGDNKGLRVHTNSGVSATNNELRFNTGQSSGFTFMTNSDGTSSNEKVRITSGGYVGIGSANPTRQLTIVDAGGGGIGVVGTNAGIYMGTHHTGGFQNNAAIARAAAINYHITGSKPGDLCIAGESENDLIFGTSVSAGAMNERFRIGHAGISTFSENVHLTKGSGTSLLKLENTNGTTQLDIRHTNGYGAIHYVHQGTEKWRVGQTAQADHFSVYQSSSVSDGLPYRLFIQNNGEVGINTSDPNDTLHLLRNSTNHGIKLQRGGTLPGSALVQVHSNGVLSLQGDNNIHYVSGGSQQHIWYRASTEIARFNVDGRLGIGTITIPSALTVMNSSAPHIRFGYKAGQDHRLSWDSSKVFLSADPDNDTGSSAIGLMVDGSTKFYINDSGHTGIGTDGPATLLHLKSSDPTLRIQRYNQSAYGDITADTAGKITFKSDPGNAANGDGFSFTVNNSEKVGISSAGVVDVTGSIIIDDPGGGTGLSMNGVSGQTCGVVRQRDDMQHAIIFRGSSNADGSTITGGNTTEYREYGDHVFKTGAINQHERFRITQNGQLLHTANKNSGYTARFVQANADNPALIEIDSPSNNHLRPSSIKFMAGGVDKWGVGEVYSPTSQNSFHICTGSASQANSKVMITSAGRVGVGTYNPQAFLDVISTDVLGTVVQRNFLGTTNTTNASSKLALTIWGKNHYDSAYGSTGTDAYGPMIGFGGRVDGNAPNTGDIRAGISYKYNGGLTFHTEAGGSIADGTNERFRITGEGSTVVSSGTAVTNQCEAAHSGDETLGLMVKRSICFSDSNTKGQGMVMVSHTKSSVPCDGTVTDMLTIRNREGCFIGDVYAGYSASGSAAVCHKKFHTYYNGNTLSNENTPSGRISESLDITCSSNGDVHVFKVTPNNSSNSYQNGSNLNVTISIVALSAGAPGSDNFTVTYH